MDPPTRRAEAVDKTADYDDVKGVAYDDVKEVAYDDVKGVAYWQCGGGASMVSVLHPHIAPVAVQ